MHKIDEDSLRQQVIDAWKKAVPEDGDQLEQFELMKRATKVNAELVVFAALEIDREHDNIMQAIINIGTVMGNALFGACQRIGSTKEIEEITGMDGPHNAIHALVESMSATLHAHYHDRQEGTNKFTREVMKIAMPTKDVGDA